MVDLVRLAKSGKLHTLAGLLPALLTLRGKPYRLVDHPYFEDAYRVRQPRITVYKTGRQVAKCVVFGSGMRHLSNGRPVRCGELQIGMRLLGLSGSQWCVNTVRAKHQRGADACVRVKTAGGADFCVSADHPVLTPTGYVPAGGLRSRDSVVALRFGGHFGDAQVSPQEVLAAAVATTTRRHQPDGRIPAAVFDFNRNDLRAFLRQLWRSAHLTLWPHVSPYESTAPYVAHGLRGLLWKFGIATNVILTRGRYYTEIQSYHGRNAFRQLLESSEFPDTETDASRLDAVIRVESLPDQPTWDVELDGTHNYALDGIITHNTTNMAAEGIIKAAAIPQFSVLYVTPLWSQLQRFSSNYLKPFLQHSPVRRLLVDKSSVMSVTRQTFRNGSKLELTFAYTTLDRTRGFSSDRLWIDEVQDMNREFIPIISEVIGASPWRLQTFTGTPKTLENTIEGLWQDSSQAEWIIPCQHCTTNGHRTWNIPSIDFHVDKMLGPYRDDISPENPGVRCYKCGGALYVRQGRWLHRHPDRRWSFAGYHVPQIILPWHCEDPERWAEILRKRDGHYNTTSAMFYNETMGESYDLSTRLVSLTELQQACSSRENDLATVLQEVRSGKYLATVMAIDWGGGGVSGTSWTTLAVLGITNLGKISVLFGRRLYTPHDHLREAREIYDLWKHIQPTFLAHDYQVEGSLRETFLVQAGVPLTSIFACAYCRMAAAVPCYRVPPNSQRPREHYRVDKTRTLLLTCSMIRLGALEFFRWDRISDGQPGLISDFLALIDHKRETSVGELYTIGRAPDRSDDFAQAVNIGCVALWYRLNMWPNLHDINRYFASPAVIEAVAGPHADVIPD